MLVIGLTGGIGSGKTTVAQLLGEHGAAVIDADTVGHDVYLPHSPAWKALVEAFGREILCADGSIDRQKLGARVFANSSEMQTLTSITWPEIKARIREMLDVLRASHAGIVVIEAAVLIEAGWQDLADEVWAVVTPPELALAHLTTRGKLGEQQARKRIEAQLTNEERVRAADVAIDNSGSLDDLAGHVDRLWQDLLTRAA